MKLLVQPFLMAPMAGVTDAAFRARLRRNGCRKLSTEMVSAAALARGNRKTLGYLQVPDLGPDLAVQLFGSDPNELETAARLAEAAGFAHVDFNMGCPVRKVVRSGAGAALMADLGRAEQCIRGLRRAVTGTLSVKLRAGWDESSLNCTEAARMAADCGADLIVLHARTRAQGYSGKAEWSLVRALAEAVAVPVVGNGDASSGRDALEKLRTYGCAGVMIGRAALSEPWIFREAAELLSGDRPEHPGPGWIGEDLAIHLDDLCGDKGERVAVFEIRKFAAWAARGMAGAADFRRRVQARRDLPGLRGEIVEFFGAAAAAPREERMGAA